MLYDVDQLLIIMHGTTILDVLISEPDLTLLLTLMLSWDFYQFKSWK